MKIFRSTREYENWLGSQLNLVDSAIQQKHKNMASDPFIFLRATFYRWAQIFPDICKNLCKGPSILAIGDLHIENFGTWRDAEGRLIWGINDFDEVYFMPYSNDLVRLVTSAKLAGEAAHLQISFRDACSAILAGYQKGLEEGGRPFVLGEQHPELRKMAIGILRDPVHFWKKMDTQTGATKKSALPKDALAALISLLPDPSIDFKVFAREAGQGSLGRQRYVAIADYRGGRIAREVKALCPSACVFAEGKNSKKILYKDMLEKAVRCPDPFVTVKGNWVLRRLAPDCSKIDLSTLPQERDERILLEAMGYELANVHLATRGAAKSILADLKERESNWLADAGKEMADATKKDWKLWREKNPI